MGHTAPRLLTLVACAGAVGLGIHLSWQSMKACEAIAATRPPQAVTANEGNAAPAEESSVFPTVSVDEIFANVMGPERTHSLALKLELELFDQKGSSLVVSRISGIRHAVIQTAREQKFASLDSLAGKLYFKEALVSRINEFLGSPTVRDVHLSSFYLQ